MAMYYYDRYNREADAHNYSNPDSVWTYSGGNTTGYGRQGYANVTFTAGTAGFETVDPYGVLPDVGSAQIGYTFYTFDAASDGKPAYRYANVTYDNVNWEYLSYYKSCDDDPTYKQGSTLLEANIVAEDGTYPDDDEQGSYWYIKREMVGGGLFALI